MISSNGCGGSTADGVVVNTNDQGCGCDAQHRKTSKSKDGNTIAGLNPAHHVCLILRKDRAEMLNSEFETLSKDFINTTHTTG